MSFKFNFGDSDDSPESDLTNDTKGESAGNLQLLCSCQEHNVDNSKKLSNNVELDFVEIGDVTMRFVNPEHAASGIENESITALITSSDLESGKYEGGLKIWECTYDLLTYMETSESSLNTVDKHVLDLGCGAGLLGLFTFLKGAKSVCFQDYNSEVIEAFTIPSVCGTLDKQSDFKQFDFLSGDWSDVNRHLKETKHAKFDLILSSETIYNVEYYSKLRDLLLEHLSPDGVAYFAAKTHYFGVGGGTYDFVNFLSESELFKVTTAMKFEDGLCREILKVVKIKQN